jgi:hypothetical protein
MGKIAIILANLGGAGYTTGGAGVVLGFEVFSDCIAFVVVEVVLTSYFFIFFFNEEAAFYLVFLLDSPLNDLFFC